LTTDRGHASVAMPPLKTGPITVETCSVVATTFGEPHR